MISVIIPVLNQLDLTKQLFGCIAKNTIQPSEIILIDNASEEDFSIFPEKFNCLNIKYIRNEKNIGVNPAWNLGISLAKYKYISILNNDIIISSSFFKKIFEVFENPKNKEIGIVVPNTVKNKDYALENDDYPIIMDLKKREGWAFTIRKEILDKIDPIPPELNLFFGDDYLFNSSLCNGYKNVKIINSNIYHYKGASSSDELKPTMKKEREEWDKIKNNFLRLL